MEPKPEHKIFLLSLFLLNFLKYLEITLISLGDLAGIEGGRFEIEAGLATFLPFLEIFLLLDDRLNYIFTLHLKEKFSLSTISLFHSAL